MRYPTPAVALFTSLLLACTLVGTANATPRDTYPKNPNIDALNYTFDLTLSDDTDRISGMATLDVRFKTAGIETLRLDLIKAAEAHDGKGMEVTQVTMGGSDLAFRHEDDALWITLPTPAQAMDRRQLTVHYHGIPATGLKIGPNKHGDRTFFSDNWPNRARNWLPVIDHPYDKARCEFIVTAPDHYQVASNGLLVETTDLGDGQRRTHWRQSVPIAPWLYALAVARFAVQHVDTYKGKSIQTWVYYQDREAGFYDFAVPTKAALTFYGEKVGPFAYEKLANVQSNSVGGGMEAATVIFYGDRSVTGERSERWRNVIIHEVAHQWFGNAVTEYDWDDVWLSEGFATYFTLLFIEHAYGRDAFVAGLKASQERVNRYYADNPGYRIVHDNLDDMSKVTSSQTYQKGSWILHMLRGIVGDDAFWAGIQAYYHDHYNGHATTADFRRAMEEASGQQLDTFFDQWLYKPGTLQVTGDWHYDPDAATVTVRLQQVQNDGSLFVMPIPVGVRTETGLSMRQVMLDDATGTFTLPAPSAPTEVVLDPDTWVLMESMFAPRED